MTKKAIIDARQVELRNKTKVLGTDVRERANVILNKIDQELDYPLRIHASFPNPDSRLVFAMSPLDLGDGAKQVLPPVSSQVWELPESSIDFQTQLTTGTNFLISWPTSTVGFFRRAGFTLLGNGEIQVLFSSEEAVQNNLANAGSLFVKSGLPLGYIDLVATNVSGLFKTASSATNIIENTDIYRFGSGAGTGGGTGDANELLERLKNRLNAGIFGYLTANIFSLDAESKVDSSTAAYNIVDETYFFSAAGQNVVSKQSLDNEFLEEGVDIEKAEVIAYWDSEAIDENAVYELSRDGGVNWQAVNVERVGASETFRGIHTFEQEPTNAYQQELGTLPTLTFNVLTPAVQPLRTFVLTETTRINSISLNLQKEGNPLGNIYIRVVKDDSGSPSSLPEDIVAQSPMINITSITNGIRVFNANFVATPGVYHVVVYTTAQYSSSYNVVTTNISIGANAVGFVNSYVLLQGRELDLRLRVTSSAGDVDLRGYGIFYKNETLVDPVDSLTKIQRFSFIGNVDNPNEFVLNWIPDPRFLYVYEVGEGKVYRYGFFLTNGGTIVFEPNTFNKPGNVVLEFVQIVGSFDGSDLNSAALAANHLGSTDATIDFSAPGRGIFLRRPDGTLRELLINNDDDLEIWSV